MSTSTKREVASLRREIMRISLEIRRKASNKDMENVTNNADTLKADLVVVKAEKDALEVRLTTLEGQVNP